MFKKIVESLKNLSKLQKVIFVLALILNIIDWGTTILWAGWKPETESNLFYRLGVPMGYLPFFTIPYSLFFLVFGSYALKTDKNFLDCWFLFHVYGSISAIFGNYLYIFEIGNPESRLVVRVCSEIFFASFVIYKLWLIKHIILKQKHTHPCLDCPNNTKTKCLTTPPYHCKKYKSYKNKKRTNNK